MAANRPLFQQISGLLLILSLLNYSVLNSANCITFQLDGAVSDPPVVKPIRRSHCHPETSSTPSENKKSNNNPIECNYCIVMNGGLGNSTSFPTLVKYVPSSGKRVFLYHHWVIDQSYQVNHPKRAPPGFPIEKNKICLSDQVKSSETV